jgi:hypothetical protein
MDKYYDPSKIKEIIEGRKADVVCAEVGMAEDWFWTAETIYKDGKYTKSMSGNTVEIAGIISSYWATPEMRLLMQNGDILIFQVWFEPTEEQEAAYGAEALRIHDENMRMLKELEV